MCINVYILCLDVLHVCVCMVITGKNHANVFPYKHSIQSKITPITREVLTLWAFILINEI